ncbi:hypothetical protein SAMN05216483_1274 [Streptomyces sp. 2131.1]|nr:hypothetical protein SAMN05216483_1274 [Streptomyces sp. 2131.1]
MTASTLLPAQSEAELSDFDLELQIAVADDAPLTPVAGFTRLTCATSTYSTGILGCVTPDMGPTCCA